MPLPTSHDPKDWTEAELDAALRQAAKEAGWTHRYHTYRSIRSPAGFPDLVLLRPPEALFVELKSERGQVTPEQGEWLAALEACGFEVYVWRPRDYEDALRRLLTRRRRSEEAGKSGGSGGLESGAAAVTLEEASRTPPLRPPPASLTW